MRNAPYAIVAIIAILSAIAGSERPGSWGSLWPLSLFAALAWGALCGSIIAAVFRTCFGWGRGNRAFLKLILASVLLHGTIAAQEEYVGVIREGWGRICNRLNNEQRNRNVHAVDLGEGWQIYFHGEHDEMFEVTSPKVGTQRLTREQLINLAKDYFSKNGYTLARGEIQTREASYWKRAWSLRLQHPGFFFVNCWLVEAPRGVAKLPTDRGLPDGTFGSYQLILHVRNGQLGFESEFDRAPL